MIKINYGIVREVHKKDREWKNRSMTFEEYDEKDWYDDDKMKEMRQKLQAANSGWTVMGYAIVFTPTYFYDAFTYEYYMRSSDQGAKYIALLGEIPNATHFSLHKHGSIENVVNYILNFYQKLNNATQADRSLLLRDMVFAAGKIPVEEINKMITNTGYGRQVVDNMLFPDKLLVHLKDFPDEHAFRRYMLSTKFNPEIL